MLRLFARLLVLTVALSAPSLLTGRALAQPTTDARDYEGAVFAPNNTIWMHTYVRHQTTAQKKNLTTELAIFRAGYLLRFGKLVIVPLDIVVPVVDADLKWYQSTTPNADPAKPPSVSFGTRRTPTSGPGANSVRQTGVGDIQFLPSLVYSFTQNAADYTHTYMGAGFYTTIPVGSYSTSNAPLNLGENRWTFKPQVMVGQRFAKILTAEVVANMLAYTHNSSFHPVTALPVGTLSQKNSYNAELHLGMDVHPTMFLSASYYLQELGEKTYSAQVPSTAPAAVQAALKAGLAATHINAEKATVHTLRLSMGIHIEKQSLLLLQYQQDLKTSGDESNTLRRSSLHALLR